MDKFLFASPFVGGVPLLSAGAATCVRQGQAVACGPLEALATGIFLFTTLALIIIMVAGLWKTFEKGGKHGWAALVPIYNTINLLEIAGKPTWWIFFFFIPFVNMIMGIVLAHYIAISFGKGIGFTIGLIILPFVFYPILGFGDATYRKPTAPASNPSNQTPPTSTT